MTVILSKVKIYGASGPGTIDVFSKNMGGGEQDPHRRKSPDTNIHSDNDPPQTKIPLDKSKIPTGKYQDTLDKFPPDKDQDSPSKGSPYTT